jgi:type IV pilus assembly protein PilA
MFKFIQKQLKNKKGFTLVELVVVIAILGILAAIAVPKLSKSRENAALSAHNANVRTLESAATLAVSEGSGEIIWNGTPTPMEDGKLPKNAWENYLQSWPDLPSGLIGKNYKGIDDDGDSVDVTIGEDEKYMVVIGANGEITVTPPKAITD